MTPSRLMLVALALWVGLGAASAALSALLFWWQLYGIVLAATAVVDAALSTKQAQLAAARNVDLVLPWGEWRSVSVTLRNLSGRSLGARWADHYPPHFAARNLTAACLIPAGGTVEIHYEVKPERRGDASFRYIDVLVDTPLRLWHKRLLLPAKNDVKVYPNFAEIFRYTWLATDHRLSQIGVRQKPRRGEGHEFHQLREYRLGDALRQIDWKASSRVRKLISKEYQDERDQQIVFLLDLGRRMRHEERGRAHLDQVLNAMLLLSYVALTQGDAVGLMSFAGAPRWVAPRKSRDTVPRLMHQVYDLEATARPADYMTAATELMARQRRRALLVLITNTRDEDQPELVPAVAQLRRRHLVVVADLREAILDETLATPIADIDDALRFHAVNSYLAARRRHHQVLRHHHVNVIDCQAAKLPIALINHYYEVKRSGVL